MNENHCHSNELARIETLYSLGIASREKKMFFSQSHTNRDALESRFEGEYFHSNVWSSNTFIYVDFHMGPQLFIWQCKYGMINQLMPPLEIDIIMCYCGSHVF